MELLFLPESARLGTDFADVSFYAGEHAKANAAALDAEWFENVRIASGFVNADLTKKAILSLLSGIDIQQADFRLEEMTEEELFSPVVCAYLAILPRATAKKIERCPAFQGERRKLLLRLIAAYFGDFSLTEELSLCKRVMDEMRSSFLNCGEDESLSILCSVSLAVLKKRIDGGFA
ncbi:MAG: hypothetical protein ACOYIR_00830 [Christensenellales bacterium]|jgi:hypothetical protein